MLETMPNINLRQPDRHGLFHAYNDQGDPSFIKFFVRDIPLGNLFTRVFFLIFCMGTGIVTARILRQQKEDEIALRTAREEAVTREAFLRTLFRAIPDRVGLKDPQGVYLACNPSLALLLGTSDDEIIGKTDYDFFDKEIADRYRQNDLEVMDQGTVSTNEESILSTVDGHQEHLESIKAPMYRTNGELIGVLAIGRDITERKQAVEKLKESEKNFRHMIETLPLAVYLSTDVEENLTYMNPTFISLFGYSAEEIPKVADWIQRAYPNCDRRLETDWTQKVQRAIDTQIPIEPTETVVTCKDGTKKNIQWGFVPLGEKNYAYGLDLTEQKKATEKLEENQRRYIKAQRLGQVGNWEFNLKTEHFWASDEAKRIYGFDPEVYELNVDEVEKCIPDRERVHQALVDLIERDKPYNIEFEIHPMTGPHRRTVNSVAELIRNSMGAPVKVTGVVQNITERKQAENNLARHQATLESDVLERTQELREFVNAMAGREIRMAELKEIIKKLCSQLEDAGIPPQDAGAEENENAELDTLGGGPNDRSA